MVNNQSNFFGTQTQSIQEQFTNPISLGSPQAMFQPGFAGTDAQHVARQNAESANSGSNVQGGFNQFGGQFGQQNQGGFNQFGGQFSNTQQAVSGPRAMFQPGFAGTNPQHVARQNAESANNSGQNVQGGGFNQFGGQFGQQNQGGFNQFGGQFSNAQQAVSGPRAMFQPGFAGTNPQHVARQNAESANNSGQNVQGGGFNQFGRQSWQQNQGGFNQFGGQFSRPQQAISGPRAMFQPGFAGTDPQHVARQNAESANNSGQNVQGGGFNQFGGQFGQQNQGGFNQFGGQFSRTQQAVSGPNAMFQPGFAGTDVQHVARQNALSANSGPNVQGGFNQFGGQSSQQNQGGFNQFGGQFSGTQQAVSEPQAMFQSGFAGTDVQHVARQNAESANSGPNVQGGF